MEWVELYKADTMPSPNEINEYIDNPLWEDLGEFIKKGYNIEPKYSYSRCSGQPGWNVKYQKAGRSLCTLYPMQGYFITLIVIGTREEMEAELLISNCTDYIKCLYQKSSSVSGARWLMIEVTDQDILNDVKLLIQLRRKREGQ